MSETRILIRLLWVYFPRNWEFSSVFSKLRNFGVLNPPNSPPSVRLLFLPCSMRRSRNNQHYASILPTLLFYILAPTCFGSNLPSSGSFLVTSELLEIQIEWVVYHIMCGYVTCVLDCRGSVCCASVWCTQLGSTTDRTDDRWFWSTPSYSDYLTPMLTLFSLSRNNQHYALICTTPLFYILAATYFGSSLPSSGSLSYVFFWVVLRRMEFNCKRFGTMCLFHFHRRVGMKCDNSWEICGTGTGSDNRMRHANRFRQ
jgi:hypothetical protein